MARVERQCTEYIRCVLPVEICFPANKVCCDLCEFCHTENSGTRFRCMRTAEILPYHNVGVGLKCPLPINLQPTNEEENEL